MEHDAMASKKLSRNGIKLIIDFEGKHRKLPDGRYQAYLCPAGVWTIHAGVTEGVHEGMVVTEAGGMEMFKKELAKFEDAVNDLVKVEIGQNQFDALASFAYNCGSGALSKSALLKKLNKGDFNGAAAEFHKWNKGGGKVLPGLVRRRAQEAELFLTPDASTAPVMPQAVDVPAPPVATAVQGRTFRGILLTAIGFITYIFREAIEIVTAAATQYDALAPAGKVLAALGFSVAAIAVVTALAGLGLSAFARFDAALKGKTA